MNQNYIGTHLFIRGSIKEKSIYSKNIVSKYKNSIVQVIIREDNSYIGYLKELFNTPFIWIPKRFNSIHQTDSCIGSDCISFVIYGKKRQDVDINYMPLDEIFNFTTYVLGECWPGKDGVYFDRRNNKIKTDKICKEDLIYFGPHIAVYYEDRGIKGVLDKNDLIIHSIGEGAHISTLENSNYYQYPLKILRWKK